MNRKRAMVAAVATAAVALGVGGGVAYAGGESNTPITGDALPKASEAALAETGRGRVTGTEQGDEDSFYEVEVLKNDGSTVDVQLDRDFAVVTTMPDHESSADSDSE